MPGHKSVDDQERRITKHVKPFFTGWKAADVSPLEIRKYIAKRQDEGAKNATVNRELSAIGRAFTLGLQAGKVTHKPAIPKLKENNTSKGFFDAEQFKKLMQNLPAPLQRPLPVSHWLARRIGSAAAPGGVRSTSRRERYAWIRARRRTGRVGCSP